MIKLANLIIQQAVRDGLEKAAKGITTFEDISGIVRLKGE
jgi:hypothetical protein